MAVVDFDFFDHFASDADLTEAGYSSVVVLTTPFLVAGGGRFGGNAARRTTNDTANNHISKALPSTFTTIGVGAVIGVGASLNQDGLISLYEGTSPRFHLQVKADGALQVRTGAPGSGTIRGTSAAGVILASSFPHVEMKVVFATTAVGSFVVKVNGVEVLNVATVITSDGGAAYDRVAFSVSPAGSTLRPTVDSWVVWDTTGAVSNDFLGDIRIRPLYPNADTATTAWTRNAGANDYEAVDEVAADDDTSYVASSAAADKSIFDLEALPVTPSAIHGVKIVGKGRKTDGGAATWKVGVVSNAVESKSAETGLTTTYADLQKVDTLDPNTSAAWTESGVNAAQAVIERIT